MPRFGEKSVDNLLIAIDKAKNVTLPRFIFALSIPQVGEETAEDVAEHFGTIERVMSARFDELEIIEGVGPIVAQAIVDWFIDRKNKAELKKLIDACDIEEINVKSIEKKKQQGKFVGKVFVLTGTLSGMSRSEAKAIIKKNGGKVSSAVSTQTDYVVAGENPGSKYDEAEKLGIKILNEEELLVALEAKAE